MSTEWMKRAACRRVDPELFFPRGDGKQIPPIQRRRANRVCGGCPVIDDCLAYALANPWETSYGVWAATSPRRRDSLRKERAASRAGAR